MNILESQVNDLNYIAESPIAIPVFDTMNGQQQQPQPQSSESPADTGAQSGKKRKNDSGEGGDSTSHGNKEGTPHTRAKRNRYISIACNECKRRKIKCNGNTPCQRCGNLNLECQYAPNCCTNGFKESEEFRRMNLQLASLQEQVNNLNSSLNAMRHGGGSGSGDGSISYGPSSERSLSISQQSAVQALSPLSFHHKPIPRHPSFRGPTSSAFGLDVAKNTLHNMGYQSLADEGITTQDPTPVPSPPPIRPRALPSINMNGVRAPDPLRSVNREEMTRLCRVYEEEMGLMYPVVDIEELITHGSNIFEFIDAAVRNGLATSNNPQGINDINSCSLKTIMAISMIVEGSGQSDLAYRLFESVREPADRALHDEFVDVKCLPFLVLVAIFHFHCDEEALAWRIIGQVARMSIELGLHRRDSFFKVVTDERERIAITKLFWSIYVLDRRWSFGTGMPFAIQDSDIDPSLPEPDNSVPYLHVMISYSRIGSKVWKSICSFSPTPSTNIITEELSYLDFQITQWQKTIPPHLQLPTAAAPQASSRATHRLQILLYLRANQMRILIYRPVLHSASSIQEHIQHASTVVEFAKDTIRALTHLNQTTDIYRVQQVCFNYFLISALAVIFLASCHAPVTFSSICRDEFYMALDLVKGFSNKSFVSKRLWKTIKGLKQVAPKLGLSPTSNNHHNGALGADDAHSSAALAMAGLAGHEITGMGGGYDTNGHGQGISTGSGSSPMTGNQMSYEMTHLFEAALGMGSGHNGYGVGNGMDGTPGVGDDVGGVGPAFGEGDELFRQLRDLF
ncbi:hypothetical protein BCIN_11g01030 [Botrytis cinerea B05.10]|uniref:Zn(2)-C6 fungal-type domain-containing protein n=1 Tax=Botryotinia fuckeliana (strain B05.10) TaxID=332648 RepID=A0A384JW01_BOTFB|nr:hypothetical protein BCIN_11g01030 [Botrytis cinerea B05.10]ATZ54765.1 hypothetical protein BCIN_11g01030 [Botrytis cinerea B05.10]